MKKTEKDTINEDYEKMQVTVETWTTGCGSIPAPMKRAIDAFESASTEDEVVKRRSMSTIKGDYRMMLNLIQISVIDRVYDRKDNKGVLMHDFNIEMKKYDLDKCVEDGLIAEYEVITNDEEKVTSLDVIHWPRLFESRRGSTVDAATETVIAEIVKARTDMAALIDGILSKTDLMDMYPFTKLSLLFDIGMLEEGQSLEDLSDEQVSKISLIHAFEKVEEVIEAWAKTLVLETKPLSSINPKNKDLSFGSTNEILSQNVPVSKLRQYRRAFDEKFDSEKKGVLIARHKVKWSGKLEDAPVINYTPQPRAKKESTK